VTATLPTILLTRPEAQSRDFETRLRARIAPDVPVIISPVLDIVPVPFDLPVAPRFLVLTSVHAAEAARRAGLANLPAFCVGDRTAEAARSAGLIPQSAAGDASALLALLAAARPEGPGLYLRGRHTASDIASELVSAGLDTQAVVAYDQIARPLSAPARAALDAGAPIILPVFSPRSSRLLAHEAAQAQAPLDLIAISAAAAAPWKDRPVSIAIAAAPDSAAMEEAVAERVFARSAC
jgi:uroporphyrinogen-III synthase